MDRQHIEDFKSLASMDSDLSDASRRHGPTDQRIHAPNGQFNPAFGMNHLF
jgi:hypothetical protein